MPAPAAGAAAARFKEDDRISDVISSPVFEGFGRLLFPLQEGYMGGSTLRTLSLAWYSHPSPRRTAAVLNALADEKLRGVEIFHRIYSEDEIKADPSKAGTGLFFFKGRPGARTAICIAGGGFQYVGAIHDSLPQAMALSEMGCNAFALIYRPGAYSSCADLSRALVWLHRNAKRLEISMDGYLLEGGSAGARTADWVGSYGTESFGEAPMPRPAALALEYTGLDEVTGSEPPTYMVVGEDDPIAPAGAMEQRSRCLRRHGIDSEIEIFEGLGHGFGLGEGTAAEGWIARAAEFWQRHLHNEGQAPAE